MAPAATPATGITIHIDGAARGNPGPAAFAYRLAPADGPVIEEAQRMGHTTNNVAEYTALVRALERATTLGDVRLTIYSDSELLVKQMNGEYRVKSPELIPLYQEACGLRKRFAAVSIQHVRREQNKRADELCNEALDGKRPGDSLATPGPAKAAKPKKSKAHAASSPNGAFASARAECIDCLQAAAAAWSAGNPNDPPVEWVFDQLLSVLEEQGLVQASGGRKSPE